MFVRFVTGRVDADSGRRQGVFQAAYHLRTHGTLASFERDRLTAALDWFDEHLSKSSRLSRSRRPHRHAQAICWFKADAKQHLARIREIQHILDRHGVMVDMITSRRPGYIVYEDHAQVAAYPFNDTTT
jgi:hypothetical protein